MWFSLLALPAAVACSLLLLFRIERRWWRRSVQVALILSLAFHLFVVIVACGAKIFPGLQEVTAVAVRTTQPEQRLEISAQPREQIWNEPNELETPQPEVELERAQPSAEKATEISRPLPTNDEPSQPSPQLARRENSAEAVPKVGAAPSQLSRRMETNQKVSSEPSVAVAAPAT